MKRRLIYENTRDRILQNGTFCLRLHDLLNYRTDLFQNKHFRKFMIRFWWQSPLFSLILYHKKKKKELTKNLKFKIGSAASSGGKGSFRLLPLISSWGRNDDFNVLFLTETRWEVIVSCLYIASDPLISARHCPATSIKKCNC